MDEAGLHILLIEDNQGDVKLIENSLKDSGLHFRVTSSLRLTEALTTINNDPSITVILLDLSLPDSQGVDAIDRIFSLVPNKPLIILTGLDNEELAKIAIRKGAQDYLLKSALDSELLKRSLMYSIERSKVTDALLKSEERYRQLVEFCPDPIIVHQNGIIKYGNPAGRNLIGASPKAPIGKPIHQFIHPDYLNIAQERMKRLNETGKPLPFVYMRLITTNGNELEVELGSIPIIYESGPATLTVIRDISGRMEASKKQTELLTEIQNKNKELNQFASIVSHDLKAPLNAIEMIIEQIEEDCKASKFNEAHDKMNQLKTRVEFAKNLIDGILKYSRLGSIHEEKSEVNLMELVSTLINVLAPPPHVSIHILNHLPVVVCEKTRLKQVFENLISNAIKFNDKHSGKITIECNEKDSCWTFVIKDNGIGIDNKDLNKVFELFASASVSHNKDSTGMGLAIVKRNVEHWGGRVWAESVLGQCSSFYFTYPKSTTSTIKLERELN